MAKKTATTIEDNLQALIGLRYFTQEVMERDSDVPLGDTLEYVDKKIAALIAEKYSDVWNLPMSRFLSMTLATVCLPTVRSRLPRALYMSSPLLMVPTIW